MQVSKKCRVKASLAATLPIHGRAAHTPPPFEVVMAGSSHQITPKRPAFTEFGVKWRQKLPYLPSPLQMLAEQCPELRKKLQNPHRKDEILFEVFQPQNT